MASPCRVAITGTPGTGKTTIASLLEQEGVSVFSVEELAEEHGCIDGVDPKDGARPIDLRALSLQLEEKWKDEPNEMTVVDGHLSHNLPVDCVIILRCEPKILENRLEGRGYSEEKKMSNVEWEILGSSWNEYREEVPWIEFDTSKRSIQDIVGSVNDWVIGGFKPMGPGSAIDWVADMEDEDV